MKRLAEFLNVGISFETFQIGKENRFMRTKRVFVALFISSILVLGLMGGTALGQDTITIGAVQTTKGPLGAFGPSISAGLNDALMIANTEGGINGKKLKYVMADGNWNTPEDKVLFEKIMSEYKPPVMFGNGTRSNQTSCSGYNETVPASVYRRHLF